MAVEISSVDSQSWQGAALTSESLSAGTVAAGEYILVVFGLTRNAIGESDWSDGVAVTDTQDLTWDVKTSLFYDDDTNWDVMVGVALAEPNGSAATVTVTPGVDCYAIQILICSVTNALGGMRGEVKSVGFSADDALNLKLTETLSTKDASIFARCFSAGGGSQSPPSVSMGAGWSQVDELLELPSYAGSTALWFREDSTSTTVSVVDPFTVPTDGGRNVWFSSYSDEAIC